MVTEPTTASKEAMKHKTLTIPPHIDEGGGGTILPPGGDQGDVLAKRSDTTDDIEWKTLGTASQKNFTTYLRPGSTDLPEARCVYAAIESAVSSVYHPKGDLTVADLTADLLTQENVGNVYNITDSGVTTDLFVGGAGQTINVGDNVNIVMGDEEGEFLFNLLPGITDLRDYQKKELDTPIQVGGQTKDTVEDALQALAAQSIPSGYIYKGRYMVDVVGTVGQNYQTLLNAVGQKIYQIAHALSDHQAISPLYIKGYFPAMSFIAPLMYTNTAVTADVKETFNCCVVGNQKINTYSGMITYNGSSFSRSTVGNSVATTYEALITTTLTDQNKTITLAYDLYEEV